MKRNSEKKISEQKSGTFLSKFFYRKKIFRMFWNLSEKNCIKIRVKNDFSSIICQKNWVTVAPCSSCTPRFREGLRPPTPYQRGLRPQALDTLTLRLKPIGFRALLVNVSESGPISYEFFYCFDLMKILDIFFGSVLVNDM